MFAVPDHTLLVAENPVLRHPVRVAVEFAMDRDRWRHLLRYDPDERFSVLVESDERQEVWLMAWLPGQHTDLHDHAFSNGAFTIVNGSLAETVARRAPDGRPISERHELTAGQSRVFGPGYLHEVHNDGSDTAVSIHVYRDGGRQMRPYHLDERGGPVPR
jgi:predicted metal-dependent enzyme (double-stranded beta helix superfamily)